MSRQGALRTLIEGSLPANYAVGAIDPEQHAPWLIQRFLEEGSSAELRRLVTAFGRRRLRDWVVARGERQLSVRSLAFWRLALDIDSSAPVRERDLWPL